MTTYTNITSLEILEPDIEQSNLIKSNGNEECIKGQCYRAARYVMHQMQDDAIYVEGIAIPSFQWDEEMKLDAPILHGFVIAKDTGMVIDALHEYIAAAGIGVNGKFDSLGVHYIPVCKYDYREMVGRALPISLTAYTKNRTIPVGAMMNKHSDDLYLPRFLQAYDALQERGFTRTGWDYLDFCRSSSRFMNRVRQWESYECYADMFEPYGTEGIPR